MKHVLAVFVCLLLSACANTPTPEPVIRTVEVLTPVPQPCDAASRLGPPPSYPDTDQAVREAPGLFEQVRLLLAGRVLRIARGEALESAISTCSR